MNLTFAVYHAKSLRYAPENPSLSEININEYDLVAEVTLKPKAGSNYDNLLEEVYVLTNNKFGSWSRSQTFVYDGEVVENQDYDSRIEVLAKLPVSYEGQVMGLRSTSVGDLIGFDTDLYVVDVAGFKKLL